MSTETSQTNKRSDSFPPHPWIWLLLTAAVILADWYTKQIASQALALYRPVNVFPGFNFTLAHNYGAAFSFLSSAGGWQRWFFIVLSTAVSVFIFVWMLRLRRPEWMTSLGLALILGGAIGNLVDRVLLGYVVDFIDVYYKQSHFPAFNIADSAITCGVIVLMLDTLLQWRAEKRRVAS